MDLIEGEEAAELRADILTMVGKFETLVCLLDYIDRRRLPELSHTLH
jgi:hypothetical protein